MGDSTNAFNISLDYLPILLLSDVIFVQPAPIPFF